MPPEEIAICDLSDADDPPATGWRRPDAAKGLKVGVDPVLGRLALPAGAQADAVEVGYAYGFPGDLGGGPYDRTASVAAALADLPDPDEVPRWQTGVTVDAAGDPTCARRSPTRSTRGTTLTEPDDRRDRRHGQPHLRRRPRRSTIRAGSRLLIVAADWPADEEPDPEPGAGPERRFGRLLARGRRPHVGGAIDGARRAGRRRATRRAS